MLLQCKIKTKFISFYLFFFFFQVKSMTTRQFILEVEPDEWTHFTYKIKAQSYLLDQTVVISAVSECYDGGN